MNRSLEMTFSHSLDEDKWGYGVPDCHDCDGVPPPFFSLPPPPCPPGLDVSTLGFAPTSCPSALRSREEPLPQEQNLQLGVVFVTVGGMAALSTVVLLVFFGYRIMRTKVPKTSDPPLHGAIIYDDLNSSPGGRYPMSFYDPSRRSSPRGYKGLHPYPLGPNASSGSDVLSTTLYRYTSEPKRMGIPVEHLYSSISSGSGSEPCTCSTSDGASAEVRSLMMAPVSSQSPIPHTATDSEEEDFLSPFLRRRAAEDSDSQEPSPSHGRYYLNVPLTSLRPTVTGRGIFCPSPRRSMTSSLTSMEKGLPPLPSRRDKFRIYSPQTTRGRRNQHFHQYVYSKPPGSVNGDSIPPPYDRSKIINRFSHIYQNA